MQSLIRKKIIQKTTIVGAVINLFLAIIKIIIGYIGNSSALVADGVHSLSDLLSDFFIWYAAKKAAEKPDKEHPYGHEKFESIATLGVSVFLIFIGAGIIFNGFNNLFLPNQLTYTKWLLAITIISIISKELLYWYSLLMAKKIKSEVLRANAWHHRTDSLSSIIVLISIFMTTKGYPYLEVIASIIIGFMIIFIAFKLGINTIKDLVDTSIEEKDIKKIEKTLYEIDGIKDIHCLRTRRSGAKISADVHIQVSPFISVSEGHLISIYAEKKMKELIEELKDITIHIDPEDDQNEIIYPQRKKILNNINKKLKNINFAYNINNIRLHYFKNKIFIDLYIDINCLEREKIKDIKDKLSSAINEIDDSYNTKVYFE